MYNPRAVAQQMREQIEWDKHKHTAHKGFKYSPDQPRDDHGRWTSGESIGDEGSSIAFEATVGLNNHIDAAMKPQYADWASKLTPDESRVLSAYAQSSSALNNYMRYGDAWKDIDPKFFESQKDQYARLGFKVDDWAGEAKTLESALGKAKTPENMTVWRGIDLDRYTGTETDMNFKPGDTFEDKGFASTSLNPHTAYGFGRFGTMVKINIPKGSPAAYVDAAVGVRSGNGTLIYPKGEAEMLLQADSKFKVTSVDTNVSMPLSLIDPHDNWPGLKDTLTMDKVITVDMVKPNA